MEPENEYDRAHLWLLLTPLECDEFDDYVDSPEWTDEQLEGLEPEPESEGFTEDAGMDDYDPDFAHFQYCGLDTPVEDLFEETDLSEDERPRIISSCRENGITHATAVCLLSDSSHSDTPFTDRNGLVYIGEFDMD